MTADRVPAPLTRAQWARRARSASHSAHGQHRTQQASASPGWAEQEAAEYRATVREAVDAFDAAYNAETVRMEAAAATVAVAEVRMARAMDRPRICRLCAKVFPGGGDCTGPPERRHPEVIMYASNE